MSSILIRVAKVFCAALVFSTVACNKSNSYSSTNLYTAGEAPLGIKFLDNALVPASGAENSTVSVGIQGLKKYAGELQIAVNGTPVTAVKSVTDSMLVFSIPKWASTGAVTVQVKDQVFFGPVFKVEGKLRSDVSFRVINGATGGSIFDFVPNASGYILAGSFSDYEYTNSGTTYGGLVQVDPNGVFLHKYGRGANSGSINSLAIVPSTGKLMIAGNISLYDTFPSRPNISNIARIDPISSLLDTMKSLVNSTQPLSPPDTAIVSAFNGGISGTVSKVFVQPASLGGKIVALGNFNGYQSVYYPKSTLLTSWTDFAPINNLVRMNYNGSIDSTYNYSVVPGAGLNGIINDAYMLTDGSIITVGLFTSFNGKSIPHNIAKFKADGTIDNSFGGLGSDGIISSITYNGTSFLLTGSFKNFNGTPANGVVMLNSDGSVNTTFKCGQIIGGSANYAVQLSAASNNYIIVTGSFNKYTDNVNPTVVKQGFMVLDQNGNLVPAYNNMGLFEGATKKIIEITNSLGHPAIMMVGNISKFDGKPAGNIVRIELLK
ncbi:DUF5008 domain-containing protein [Pinibacter soli]|uniref:DUF5008 domain-containing protein n=1 Tax=Pinibacter soli TaxID=3044211 RepID=A0ABT6RJH6_9BACT|nr:DUF5008 domain-containing protein [Pinibacter soli]MDI3322719.1 DUF5008 domain-containing protein [Pinibacter soli]